MNQKEIGSTFGICVSRGGNVTTTHEYYTDFEIDGVAFRCYGDLTFKDGDRVKFYATNSGKGYYIVNFLNNFTRGFYAGETPRTYGLFERGASAVQGFAPVIGVSFFVAFFIALILWGLFSFGFWKTFENSLLTLLALSLIIIIAEFMKKDNGENIRNIYNTLTGDE